MALFHGNGNPIRDQKDQYFRSNTKLQAGTHDSPGEKFLIDPRLKRLFRYHFGGDGYVVIPKGRVIAPATDVFDNPNKPGQVKDFDTNAWVPVITLANGGVDVTETGKTGAQHTRQANRPIGVAYGNLYEQFVDGFNGMQPTVENEIYIELPYIPLKADAEEVEWGSFYDADPTRPAQPGDYVMSDTVGRVIKADFDKLREDIADAADLAELKVALTEMSRLGEQSFGQIWAVETPIKDGSAPTGWLKWVQWSQEDMRSDDKWINNSGFRPEDIGTQDGFPGYPYERTYNNMDIATGKYQPKGIPGLTNGANIEVSYTNEVIGMVNAGQSGRHDFRLLHLPAIEGSAVIKAGNTTLDTDTAKPSHIVYINYELGLVVVNVDNTAGSAPIAVTATYKATGQIPGIPTGWDFKGSIGAVRILLHK
ncbi:hypothetical protein GZH47_32785 (plasmid) [Paenibacillus rhizovicinus]|uniref:Uncharacterized protein n=1 Tax=Paenibacillus rhizovicinus TaxID=2704463 RepID=A0A6C0PB62_9BACL|nr:hypothetical protein [Paenibacillus rhizovicinus]QHW35676.1 hypothetical protein GZH47_32785 [Paenibacillus rhizovicinus]